MLTRKAATKFAQEIQAWANGLDIMQLFPDGSMNNVTPDWDIDKVFIIADSHIEARVEHALGNSYLISYDKGETWHEKWKPCFNEGCITRPKPELIVEVIPYDRACPECGCTFIQSEQCAVGKSTCGCCGYIGTNTEFRNKPIPCKGAR